MLFYGSNSWTRLGRIQYSNQAELESFLKAGQGNVSVTLSLGGSTGMNSVRSAASDGNAYYSLSGQRLTALGLEVPSHGVYIKNGKKYIR